VASAHTARLSTLATHRRRASHAFELRRIAG
jgi:hypothetical protein